MKAITIIQRLRWDEASAMIMPLSTAHGEVVGAKGEATE